MNAGKLEFREEQAARPSFFARILTRGQISTGRARGAAILGLLVLLTLIGGLWRSAPADEEPAQAAVPVLAVAALIAEQLPAYSSVQSFVGRIEAARESHLGFERGGQLIEVLVDEGETVTAGQVLARLDTRSLAARQAELIALRREAAARLEEMQAGPRAEVIAAARADVARWQAEAELAGINQERQAQLHEKGAITDQQWDETRYNEQVASANHQQAVARLDELLAGTRSEQIAAQQALLDHLAAQLQSLQVEQDKSELQAPFAGRVAARLVDEGYVLSPGQPVVELLETGSLRARIGVTGEVATELATGQVHQLQHNGQPVPAEILAVRPDRNQQTRTVAVLFQLDATQTKAQPHTGDLITFEFTQKVPVSGYWLPIASLSESVRGLWCCYRLEALPDAAPAAWPSAATHRVGRCELELLHTETERAFVRGTLRSGDQVIAHGVHRLVPGQVVRLAPDEAPAIVAQRAGGEL